MKQFDFPIIVQLESTDCGPTCLRMIAKYHGKTFSANYINHLCSIDSGGTTIYGLAKAAEKIGFKALAIDAKPKSLTNIPLPAVAFWQQRHFVVIYKLMRKYVYIADPLSGLLKYKTEEFLAGWLRTSDQQGMIGTLLLLEPKSNNL